MILKKYSVRVFVEDDYYEALDETGWEALEETIANLGIVTLIEREVTGKLIRDPDLDKVWARAQADD
jgi:hypothetical protein